MYKDVVLISLARELIEVLVCLLFNCPALQFVLNSLSQCLQLIYWGIYRGINAAVRVQTVYQLDFSFPFFLS